MCLLEAAATQDEYVRNLMAGLIESLVNGDVTLSLVPSEGFTTLEVRASPEILSVLIGTKGQMARALRTLLAGSGAKLGRRYAFNLIENHSLSEK